MKPVQTFRDFIATAFEGGAYSTDDVIAFVLPLFREVLALHEEGLVAPFEREEALFVADNRLDIDESKAHAGRNAGRRLSELFRHSRSLHFEIVGNLKLDTDVTGGSSDLQDLQLHLNRNEPLQHPAYVPGYRCFEEGLGHHDDLTDIFCLGLLLGSTALGLDLYDEEDLRLFVSYRKNPAAWQERIHPTVSTLITEMTELDRHQRAQDLYDIIQRLEHYRDFDLEKQLDLSKVAGWKTKEISSRGQFILGKLRNRLFDTSRRNRLLYYKPNARFVNLTVSSVPMVLHYQSIRPELLFTWNEEISGRVRDMKDVLLNKYLRFEDHPYLTSSLDKIRSESVHNVQEYGFSQLKLVIAFLNWHNLKEDPKERIQSPILLIPVELKKNKKLKEDHYVLKVLANEAEVNPVLAHQLHELYGIRLPDFIDLDDTTVERFCNKLQEQIRDANQGITLHFSNKPRIRMVHSVARQTIGNYRKRLRRGGAGMESYKNIPYSYTPEQFRPLGLELFRQRVQPGASFLEFLVNEDVSLSPDHLSAPAGTRERKLFEMAEGENNPYSWDFDVCNIVLGNFNYKKMSLVRDYNGVVDAGLHHPVFESLFDDTPRKYDAPVQQWNRPEDWYHVITADPTQTAAVLKSRTGESYIIQGPPGTGKSQTITNLIADFLAQGKSILFVCEKRAALDVVYHRLKQQGLDELCCYIHDSQGDKRAFIKNLKETYEDFIGNRHNLAAIEEERAAILGRMDQRLDLLQNFHDGNRLIPEQAGLEVRKLMERLVELRPQGTRLPPEDEALLPYYKDWITFGKTIRDLEAALEETGAEPHFSGHPFSLIREEVFLSPAPHSGLPDAIGKAKKGLEDVLAVCREYNLPQALCNTLDRLVGLVQDAVVLHPLAESGNIRLVQPRNPEAVAFDRELQAYRELQGSAKGAAEKNRFWQDKLPESDTEAALSLAREQEGSFFSFFNGSWRRLKKSLNNRYDFTAHAVRPSYSAILEGLKTEQDLAAAVSRKKEALESAYRLPNIDVAEISIGRMRAKLGDKEVDFLVQHPRAEELIRVLYRLQHPVYALEEGVRKLLHEGVGKEIPALYDDLDSILANLGSLNELLPVLRSFAAMPEAFRQMVRLLPLGASSAEEGIARKTLKLVYRNNRAFGDTDQRRIEMAVQEIGQDLRKLQQVNALLIRARRRDVFLQHLELSNRALSGLTPEQKAFKKGYAEGRKILENEFGKSMRYKSIRELAGKESGTVLKDLKPVWLMSPLSVSDSLPVAASTFDVVIFDEASQITLEEGVPSLYRAPQAIIVGDDKQMPPTNFFSARAEDPDDLETFSEEDDTILSNDADSLLVQGSRKWNSVMLGWHYRSRYETLISYSNHAFYEARLLTIPDRVVHHAEKEELLVAAPEDAHRTVSSLFDRSISYHYLGNSLYEKRTNAGEAAYIAQLVRALLVQGVEESIGIVAFSQEQQGVIEDALTTLAATDKKFELLLEQAYARTENDQFVGLIVKNLENIQGDERDIIILSICYGFDARGKMLMNFGPINRKGGEKRLNVIFSRARKHMAVISSIKHTHITNEYNEGASFFRRFLQYAEGVSTGRMENARTILDSLVARKESGAPKGTGAVLDGIKAALVEQGYEVATGVGQSGFKCSLAVKAKPEDTAYTLSILIDDDSHYGNENLLEQYYQRPAVLKDFGWRILAVFTKDWLEHPERVLQEIGKRLHEAPVEENKGEEDTRIPDGITTQVAPQEETETVPAVASPLFPELTLRRLHYTEGGSNKFWEAGCEGSRLVVRFGRIGTKGQTQIRTFADSAAAQKECEKMIGEKRSKGYTDSPAAGAG